MSQQSNFQPGPGELKLPEGEALLWTGHPSPPPVSHRAYLKTTIITTVVLIACFYILWGLHPDDGVIALTSIGLTFDAFVLLIIPFAYFDRKTKIKDAKFTIYRLTNRRAIISKAKKEKTEDSYYLSQANLNKLQLVEKVDGSGNLYFSHQNEVKIGFENIAEVSRVKELIEQNFTRNPALTTLTSKLEQAILQTNQSWDWPESPKETDKILINLS